MYLWGIGGTMFELQSPIDVQLEMFDDDMFDLSYEDPRPDKIVEFTISGFTISEPYHVETKRGKDYGKAPLVTVRTTNGSEFSGLRGFLRFTDPAPREYEVYAYRKNNSFSRNDPTIKIDKYNCVGYRVEGSINSFGSKEQDLSIYTISPEGHVSKHMVGSLTAVIKTMDTKTVVHSNLGEYYDRVTNLDINTDGKMEVTTQTGQSFANIGHISPYSNGLSDITYVLRDTDGNPVYRTNKIQNVMGKRYTVYRTDQSLASVEERKYIYPNILGFYWKEDSDTLSLIQAKESGSRMQKFISDPDVIKVYDHLKERTISLDQIKLLSELETERTASQENTEERLRSAVKNVSYTDDDLAMMLNELSNENGVLSAELVDDDYQLLREADEDFNVIVQYLIQYNWAGFYQSTDDLLSDKFIEEVNDDSIEGDIDPIVEDGATELVI